MAKAKPKAKAKQPKLDENRLRWLTDALDEQDELVRIGGLQQYWPRDDDDGPPLDFARALLAREGGADRGVASAWLRARLGDPTEADVVAIAELAATAGSRRTALAEILALVVDRVARPVLAKAVANLELGVPYASIVLGAGRAAVHAHGDPALAAVLDERADFCERHAAVLADCTTGAKEKARKAASLALTKLTGPDRLHAALWVMMEGEPDDAAITWARRIIVPEPRVPVAHAAYSLAADLSDTELPVVLAPVTPERAIDLLVTAIARDWGGAVINLGKGAPAAFHSERGFAALRDALATPDTHYSTIVQLFGSDTRYWAAVLDDTQAAEVARYMVTLLDSENSQIRKDVDNACHYFAHPGGIPVFRAALASTLTADTREAIYSAVHSTHSTTAQDLLIDRLFVETEDRRHAIFAYNKLVYASRHGEVLARIVESHSLDAAWMYVGCQVSWAHHPRHVVDVVERVLEWPGEPKRRGFILSQGVEAALELHRYELARQCLDELGALKQVADPTEKSDVDSVLAKTKLAETLAALRTKQLDANDRALLERLAAARTAGTPVALDDAQLGTLAGAKVAWAIHRDATTHEVWFVDMESKPFCYDGFGLAELPGELRTFHPLHGYDKQLPELAVFCADWTTDARSFQRADDDYRYVLRSGARLLVRFSGAYGGPHHYPLGLTFPDAEAATRAFSALAANPLPGFRTLDPFYVEGKRGGTWIYEYGNSTEYGFVVGKDACWGSSRWDSPSPAGSHEAAIAVFDAAEAGALRRGAFPRKIVLEERVRPLDDMPLVKWLDDRARDDDKSGAWHIEAFPALQAALRVTGIELDHEVELGAPATAEELAAYDAALPEPMPDAMREMWSVAATARWRVGDRTLRLLAPAEVVARRATTRAALAATIKPKLLPAWGLEHLDVFVVGTDDAPELGFDVRQQELDTWMAVGVEGRKRTPFTMGLARVLGTYFVGEYVEALVKLHPQLKRLNYGQSIHDKPATKAKAKPKKAKS